MPCHRKRDERLLRRSRILRLQRPTHSGIWHVDFSTPPPRRRVASLHESSRVAGTGASRTPCYEREKCFHLRAAQRRRTRSPAVRCRQQRRPQVAAGRGFHHRLRERHASLFSRQRDFISPTREESISQHRPAALSSELRSNAASPIRDAGSPRR